MSQQSIASNDMNDDPESKRQQPTQERNDAELSRRSFLSRLTVAGVGFGAVVVLGMRESNARFEPATDTAPVKPVAASAEPETEQLGEPIELEVDPDDPTTHFAQYWRRQRRRYWRRRRRRYWRRRRRYWRRRRRVCWWRRGRRVCVWR
jgi:hypothetical protein